MTLPISQQILELPPDFSGAIQSHSAWKDAAEIGHSRACRAAAELVLPLEERNAALIDALRELRDWQNDAPLELYREQWQAAMDKADAILKEVEL